MTVAGYHRDAINQDSVSGEGYIKRKNMFAGSKTVQLMHKLDADILNQELYMISNVEIDIEITPNDGDFNVIIPTQTGNPLAANTNTYSLEIINCRLYIKTIDLMDGLTLDIAKRLDGHPSRYGI